MPLQFSKRKRRAAAERWMKKGIGTPRVSLKRDPGGIKSTNLMLRGRPAPQVARAGDRALARGPVRHPGLPDTACTSGPQPGQQGQLIAGLMHTPIPTLLAHFRLGRTGRTVLSRGTECIPALRNHVANMLSTPHQAHMPSTDSFCPHPLALPPPSLQS